MDDDNNVEKPLKPLGNVTRQVEELLKTSGMD